MFTIFKIREGSEETLYMYIVLGTRQFALNLIK